MITRVTLLKLALIIFGLAFCLIYPLAVFWPSGWAWQAGPPYASDYFMMIVGVYATLGVFLILASRNPGANRSLILFAVWSSFVHAAVMTVQSLQMTEHMGHLFGDVPALLLIAVILLALISGVSSPSRTTTDATS